MKFEGLEIARAMAIYAHPDDAEFGMAGTVASWARAGVEVTYCMVTNGASGSDDPEMTRERLRETRYAEQRAAAKILGVAHCVFLGYEDGYLYPTLEVRRDVARQIRIHRPDVIFTMDPTARISGGYVNHPDHIAVGEVVLRSINPDASTRQMFPELWRDERLEPHKPRALFFPTFDEAGGTVVDISAVLETKVKALRAHASQLGEDEEAWVREWARANGRRGGYRAAESFRVIRFDEAPPPRRRRAPRTGRTASAGRRGVQSRSRMSTRAPRKATPSRRKRSR